MEQLKALEADLNTKYPAKADRTGTYPDFDSLTRFLRVILAFPSLKPHLHTICDLLYNIEHHRRLSHSPKPNDPARTGYVELHGLIACYLILDSFIRGTHQHLLLFSEYFPDTQEYDKLLLASLTGPTPDFIPKRPALRHMNDVDIVTLAQSRNEAWAWVAKTLRTEDLAHTRKNVELPTLEEYETRLRTSLSAYLQLCERT
ncbi:hypothetical protein DL96DRAFT_1602147 [Flagelloscypha sp. PMI_526]|nr:hypothetical protein DL96DRAFT_1602147 [Flagelloscypha sp. PMI_526]